MPTEEQTYRSNVIDKLDNLKEGVEALDTKISYTNGKVRKIILALVLLGGVVIGQHFPSVKDVISLLAGGVSL